MIFESRIDISKIWYFGNNRAKDLKLSPPKWHSPFFLTTDYSYAVEYSDYGVYTITLKSEAKSKILDFDKDSDVKSGVKITDHGIASAVAYMWLCFFRPTMMDKNAETKLHWVY